MASFQIGGRSRLVSTPPCGGRTIGHAVFGPFRSAVPVVRRIPGIVRRSDDVAGRWSLQAAPMFVLAVAALALAVLLSACNGGQRPTLVQDEPLTPEPELDLELSPAPAGTPPLPPASSELPLEASADDALLAWARDRAIPYLDSCSLRTPGPGQLCDVMTERDTVRLLGPSADETWYIVTILKSDSFDFGTGYRVESVVIAGQS